MHLIRSVHGLPRTSKVVSQSAIVAMMVGAEKELAKPSTLAESRSTSHADAPSSATISRETFLFVAASAAKGRRRRTIGYKKELHFNTLADACPSDLLLRFILGRNLAMIWMSGAVQSLFLMHASVSARAFIYFDCAPLGKERYFLRADYKIECFEEEWNTFLPVALLLLCGFTFAIPCATVLFMHRFRHDLDSPSTRQRIGFLMAPYRKEVYW